ncbi:MAG: hypothetical protein ACR2MT_00765 [Aurantibacter sp.]
MTDTAKTKFSNNLIALAGLITAVGGLLTVLHQTGVVSFTTAEKNQTIVNRNRGDNAQEERKIDPPPKEDIYNNIIPVNNELAEPEKVFVNLSGYWYDEINGGRYHFVHDSSGRLAFQEFSWMNGVWITSAEGSGTIQGQMISLAYTTAYGMSGAFEGTIDEEGGEVVGYAMDHSSGLQTSMYLNRE